jgi:hypothetical protein
MQDTEASTRRLVADSLTPQPGRYFLDPPGVPSGPELGIPAEYMRGEDDRALPRPGTAFAARLGLDPSWCPGRARAC